ncbi:MAG: PP2C family serine/threonine-protein phosphatase [Thermoleophilia bacterium]
MRTGRGSALTDTGRRRPHNEDTFVCEPPLFAVADGVGGAQAGEVASRLAAATLEERIAGALGEETLATLIVEANNRIYTRALDDPAVAGMGTVVTALLVDETTGTVSVGHVGDSRAYRLRDGFLEQLTPDHSLVGELVRSGRLSVEEAEQHPHRSVITRAVGTEPLVEVHTDTLPALPGDLYLICSDGLTDMVRDTLIVDVLVAAELDPDRAAEALVDAANAAGGIDNITVVLFEILDGDPVSDPTSAGPGPANETEVETEVATEVATEVETEVAAPAAPAAPVRRHGAGAGGRWVALLTILLAIAIATLLIWWSLKQ